MLRSLVVLALLVTAPAAAEQRRIGLGSFARVRVEGSYRVAITTGASPGATIDAPAGDTGVDLRVDGNTLVIRRTSQGQWGERGATSGGAVTITLTTPALSAVSVAGGAQVRVTRMTGARVDLALGGSGAIAVERVEADQLSAQMIGDGQMTLTGRVASARLAASGGGAMDAAGLEAGDLTVHLDGLGTIAARARYTAQVSNGGLGTVTVAGKPKCRLIGRPSGTVRCGD